MKGKVTSVMSIKKVLRKIGEKSAVKSIQPRSFPLALHQPKPPAKIQELINKEK